MPFLMPGAGQGGWDPGFLQSCHLDVMYAEEGVGPWTGSLCCRLMKSWTAWRKEKHMVGNLSQASVRKEEIDRQIKYGQGRQWCKPYRRCSRIAGQGRQTVPASFRLFRSSHSSRTGDPGARQNGSDGSCCKYRQGSDRLSPVLSLPGGSAQKTDVMGSLKKFMRCLTEYGKEEYNVSSKKFKNYTHYHTCDKRMARPGSGAVLRLEEVTG